METLHTIFLFIMNVMGYIVRFLTAIAVVAVLWGIVKYFFNHSPEKRKDANKFMIYGLLSLLVIVSLWSFVHLFGSIFGVRILPHNSGDYNVPIDGYESGDSLNPLLQPGGSDGLFGGR
jgi:uncharacterized membrane-anchored protein